MRITGKLIGVKALTLVVALALVGSLGLPSSAQAVNCPTTLTNLSVLIGFGAVGCTSQDKTFSNFSYVGVDPTASIDALLFFQAGIRDQHGWAFTNTNAANSWTSDFTLGYTIAVSPGFPLTTIISSKDQMNSGSLPNGVVVNDTQSAGIGLLHMDGVGGGETAFKIYAGVTSINTSSVATIPVNDSILTYDQTWTENTGTIPGIPEPTTLLLLGSGLAGLSGWRRWHAQK